MNKNPLKLISTRTNLDKKSKDTLLEPSLSPIESVDAAPHPPPQIIHNQLPEPESQQQQQQQQQQQSIRHKIELLVHDHQQISQEMRKLQSFMQQLENKQRFIATSLEQLTHTISSPQTKKRKFDECENAHENVNDRSTRIVIESSQSDGDDMIQHDMSISLTYDNIGNLAADHATKLLLAEQQHNAAQERLTQISNIQRVTQTFWNQINGQYAIAQESVAKAFFILEKIESESSK
jgi:hypothetical protein